MGQAPMPREDRCLCSVVLPPHPRRHEIAVGLFGEIIAARAERAGPATHAHLAVLAHAALALQVALVPQVREHAALLPDLGQRRLSDVAGAYRQVPAREDVPGVRAEPNRLARERTL